MIKFFKNKKKESDAKRIYKIYENVDISERIRYIVDSEYKRMIYLAERTALNSETSFVFDLKLEEKDEPHFNLIMSQFIERLVDNDFRYSRRMITGRNKISIYFSSIDIE